MKSVHLIQQMNRPSSMGNVHESQRISFARTDLTAIGKAVVPRKTPRNSIVESSQTLISNGKFSHIYEVKSAKPNTTRKTHTGGRVSCR